MRRFVIVLALAVAAPALAQPYRAQEQARDAQAAADALTARNRDVELTNQLSALQARVQADQALSELRLARGGPVLPTLPPALNIPPAIIDTAKLASIPDAALAQSNARVRAAAENRR